MSVSSSTQKNPWLGTSFFLRHCKHAQAIAAQPVHQRRCFRADFLRQGDDLALVFGIGTDKEHLLHGAFRDKLPFPRFVLQDDGHTTAVEIKRDFINLFILIVPVFIPFFLGAGYDCHIDQVFQARLKVTIQISVAPYADIRVAVDIQIAFQNDPVLRQRPGLVGA